MFYYYSVERPDFSEVGPFFVRWRSVVLLPNRKDYEIVVGEGCDEGGCGGRRTDGCRNHHAGTENLELENGDNLKRWPILTD